MHAIILDTVHVITTSEQGYKAGDYKMIFKNTYDDEDNGKPKKYAINANHPQAPDVFYYVHIDINSDQTTDNSCSINTSITNSESKNKTASS